MKALSAILLVFAAVCSVVRIPEKGPAASSARGNAKGHITTVTSEKLDVDSARNIATFTGNVHIVDADGEMWADRMVAYFNPDSREIKTLVCTGEKVVISNRGRYSKSRRAVYTARDGRIVLTGEPRILHGNNMYGAERITFFKNEDRTIFEPKAHLIMFSEEEAREIEDMF